MSDLTKRLRERKSFDRARGMTTAPTEIELEAADRIDALEECLRNIAYAKPSTWEPDVRDQFQEWAQNKARALLEGK